VFIWLLTEHPVAEIDEETINALIIAKVLAGK